MEEQSFQSDRSVLRNLVVPPEMLIVHQSYAMSTAQVYLAPIKLAAVDAQGTMRCAWWSGNEALKGTKQPPSAVVLEDQPSSEQPALLQPCNTTSKFKNTFNNRNGTVIEGEAPPGNGSVVFYPAKGNTEVLKVGVDGSLVFYVLSCKAVGAPKCKTLERVDRMVASMPSTSSGTGGNLGGLDAVVRWRVLIRGSMAEVYVNDILVRRYAPCAPRRFAVLCSLVPPLSLLVDTRFVPPAGSPSSVSRPPKPTLS